jgi:hypothetical protein
MATLPHRYQEAVRLASVNMLDAEGNGIAVALFVSERRAISALHVFAAHYGFTQRKSADFNLRTVVHGLVHRPNEREEKASFRMVDYHESWDLAVLELHDTSSDASHFVALPEIGINKCPVRLEDEIDKLAVTSFTSFCASMAPNAVDVSFSVIPATFVKTSKHRLLYSSVLFSGNDGGAILSSKDGSLRGMHLKSVNEAREELRTGVTPAEVVGSINSLINGLSGGFFGLRLDIEEVQKFILKK